MSAVDSLVRRFIARGHFLCVIPNCVKEQTEAILVHRTACNHFTCKKNFEKNSVPSYSPLHYKLFRRTLFGFASSKISRKIYRHYTSMSATFNVPVYKTPAARWTIFHRETQDLFCRETSLKSSATSRVQRSPCTTGDQVLSHHYTEKKDSLFATASKTKRKGMCCSGKLKRNVDVAYK